MTPPGSRSLTSIAQEFLQFFFQHLTPPEQLVLDGPQGHPLHLRDLFVRELAEMPQEDQLPVLPGEPVDGLLNRVPPLPVAQLAVRPALRRRQIPVTSVSFFVVLPQRHHLEAAAADLV